MKPDKKQVPQLIVLGALVLLCIGYMSFKVMSPSAQPPASSVNQAKPEKASDTDESSSIMSTDAEAIAVPTGTFPNLTITPPRRDPFAHITTLGFEMIKAPKPAKPMLAPIRLVDNPTGRVPRIEINPFNPFSRLNERPTETRQIQVHEQDPEFKLTGVIRGDNNIAIIRSGESGRYVVRQGQLIDGRYKVESVSDDGATLVYKNRRIYVKLGGVKNAS